MSLVPTQAITVGPVETWKAETVSIWHAGQHDNPFGQRLTCLMIAKGIAALTTDAHKTKDDLVIGTDDSACVGSSELGEGVGACSGLVGENASDTAGCGCSL